LAAAGSTSRSTGETASAERVDALVVGAGILGLATAAELLERRPGTAVAVLEKEAGPALHQTGRNSCILHSGVYYPPGSLKAELCLRGRDLMLRFCEREGIPYELCGKVIVAVDESELAPLAELERRGRANGVEGLLRISPEELRELEPHCAGIAALHLPSTGILEYRLVAEALRRRIVAGGGTVRFDARVERLSGRGGAVVAETSGGELEASYAIACAGVQSDRLVEASGGDADERTSIVPFRGDYVALRPHARHLCRNLIYPVPDARFPFLGVHVSRRPDGEVWAGPNAVLALAREGYRRRDVDLRDAREALTSRAFWRLARRYWRTGLAEVVRDVVPHAFVAAARRYLPELSVRDVEPAPAGIRAQALNPDGTLVDDFLFVRSPRALHVKNAPSPGATSSLAIAGTIVDRAFEAFDL
jgi:L-2-hydroxyglutarate oxidase LhgO